MATPVPNEDVAIALALANLGTVGVTIFAAGPAQVQTGVPSQAIFCQLHSGYGTPIRYLQGNYAQAGVGLQGREPRVMLFVRSNPHDYQGGQVLARAVKDALHDQPLFVAGSSPVMQYDACRIVEAEPVWLNQIDTGEHLFSLNCHLWIEY